VVLTGKNPRGKNPRGKKKWLSIAVSAYQNHPRISRTNLSTLVAEPFRNGCFQLDF
jgi:hypothetical protein